MQSKRVVIADTDVEIRHQLAQAVERTRGLDIVGQTDDGEQLLKMCYHGQCDVVVMDLILTAVDGLEVLDKLRTLHKKPAIIVLSSFAAENVAKLSIGQGVDYLMLKPCKVESVVRRIQQIALSTGVGDFHKTPISNLEMEVSAAIHAFGVPSHIKGYQYLREAIMLAMEDQDAIDRITKILYPKIAKDHATTACGVERAIRHAIEVAWDRGDVDTLYRVFGCTVSDAKGKPTNSEFIALIAERLQLRLKYAQAVHF